MRVFWNAGVVMFLDLDAGYTDVVIWWKKIQEAVHFLFVHYSIGMLYCNKCLKSLTHRH